MMRKSIFNNLKITDYDANSSCNAQKAQLMPVTTARDLPTPINVTTTKKSYISLPKHNDSKSNESAGQGDKNSNESFKPSLSVTGIYNPQGNQILRNAYMSQALEGIRTIGKISL